MLKDSFAKAIPSKNIKGILAVIAPHAGYVYSGEVAASSFNQIDQTKEYDNVFVLGPSHYVAFEGASVYTRGDFITPLGTVKVNRELGVQLLKASRFFTDRVDAHTLEHSVEVQLPFLQYVLKKPFRIVPIVIGAGSPETYAKIADALRPYFNTRNLFVISTDFSHYPAYTDAKTVDKATGDAVLSNSVSNLLRTIGNNEKRGLSNLATSMCGEACVLTLLNLTQNNPNFSFTPIQYKNSGDSEVGDKTRVVGYYSIVVSYKDPQEKTSFALGNKEKQTLLAIARTTLERQLATGEMYDVDASLLTENLKARCGAFVTLKKNNQLRGCIGRFDPGEPLYKVVQEMTIASATQDYRFSPVRQDELKAIEFEISVLTPMRKIKSIDEIELGKHGIYIKQGSISGTFLPQVATETGWTKEEFLGHCAQDKAGIGWSGWKNADIYIYEALVFSEEKPNNQ
jgi:AmmeMemoRadiSam system protein B/AmmeMemoRadiSam system protein A